MASRLTEKIKYKITILGDTMTGKSKLTDALVSPDIPMSSVYASTIAIDFFPKKINNIQFHFWDTSGEKRFSSLIPSHINGSHLYFLVFNMTQHASFENLRNYISKIKKDIPIILIGTHSDLTTNIAVSDKEIETFVEQNKCHTFIALSSKTKEGIDTLKTAMLSLFPPALSPEDEKIAQQRINDFKSLTKTFPHCTPFKNKKITAIDTIADYLSNGLKASDFEQYFAMTHKKLETSLNTLQYTSPSLCNSALNTIMYVLSCLAVHIPALEQWMQQNNTNRGNPYLFFAFGEKQKAEVLIHQTIACVNAKPSL